MLTRVDQAPREHQDIREVTRKGLIIVNTGDGKGKSTAAFGVALRSLGRGYKVAIVQFIKGKWKTGEVAALSKFGDQCKLIPMGDGFTWKTQNFEQDVATAQRTWDRCKEFLFDEAYQVVIFDELNYVLKYNFLDLKDVIAALEKKPSLKHVIVTGNGAPAELIEVADLVTEMKLIKHPYKKGIKAQPGIEY